MKKNTIFKKWQVYILAVLCAIFVGAPHLVCASEAGTIRTLQSSEPSGGFTGWRTNKKGKRFYYIENVRQKGMVKVDGKYYYFQEKNGAMDYGWQHVDGKYRYFHKKTGVMVTGKKVNGRAIDENGVWTPLVVLDPGHSSVVKGGYEPLGPGSGRRKEKDNSGTQGVATGVEEYKLNLDVAKRLKAELEKRGCKVVLTRKNNKKAISCKERAMVANKYKADAFLRIHANGSSSSYANGAMTICTTKNSPFVSKKLSKKSYSLSQKVLDSYVEATGIRKEYVWQTDEMSGNNWSKVPTTLVELGYMSNPSEDRKMQKKSVQKKMVRGIAEGIEAFFTEKSS